MLIQFNSLNLPGLYFGLNALLNELLWLGHEILLFISYLKQLGKSFTLSNITCLC